jgi:flagellin-like hook-associated protein FlgL
MVTFGSPISSSAFTRVSSVLSRNILLANLRRNQEGLLRLQEQLSSGLRLLRASDDPLGARRVLDLKARTARNEQFMANIDTASARLALADASLDSANEIVNRARDIFLSQVESIATPDSRRLAADEVSRLLDQAIHLANTSHEDRFLFGGSRTGTEPFAVLDGAVVFRGDLDDLETDVADGFRLPTNLSAGAFGAFSDEIRGLDALTLRPIDLDPRVTAATRLGDLHRGTGVTSGSIVVTGTGTATIDLRAAQTLGDVIDLINAQSGTTGVTASISAAQNGLQLASAAPITVQEVANGRTAADLGILVTAAASPFSGGDLDPILTKDALVGDLYGGAGISSSGIVIANGTAAVTLGAVVFAPGATIEEVLNAFNGSAAQVEARINEDGTGLDIVSRLSGARLAISENGGSTAADLGLLSTLGRARPADLNGGFGLATVDGPDLRITKKDGTVLLFDLDNVATIRQFVAAVDADPDLTASINALNQIVITDGTAPAGTLLVENVGASLSASQLGIAGSAAGAGPVTITGTTVSFAGVQVESLFTALVRLRDALAADDTEGIRAAGRLLGTAQEKVLDARSDAGVKLAGLELTKNRLDLEQVELERLRSATEDADLAELATRLQIQQIVLEASLATAARILETSLLNYL